MNEKRGGRRYDRLMAETRELDLRDSLHTLRRRWRVIALCTVLCVAAAIGLSMLQPKLYEGKARVILERSGTELLFEPEPGYTDPVLIVETEIQVLRGTPVREAVKKAVKGDVPKVEASRVGESLIIEVRASDPDPRRAATLTNAFARAYIDMRRDQAVDDLLSGGRELQAKVDEIQAELDQLDAAAAAAAPDDRASVEARNAARRQALVTQQALLDQRLDQLQVEAALKTGGARLAAPASPPDSPVQPQPARNAAVAIVVGLMLGIGAAALLEHLDDSVKSKADMARAGRGLPVLGVIPAVAGWSRHPADALVSVSDTASPVAEAYRSLRTSVLLLGIEEPLRIIQVTSPNAGEGKTTTLVNLAAVLSTGGARVVAVDGDLRRGRLHEMMGVSNEAGLTSVLSGDAPLSEVLQPVPGAGQLSLLASGPRPPNPSELLSSRRTAELLFELRGQFDVVLVDSPPVLPVTDATIVAAWVDATLVVGAAGTTSARDLVAALEVLQQVDAPVAGLVLNRAPREATYAYSYEAERGRSATSRRTRAEIRGAAFGDARGGAVAGGPVEDRSVDEDGDESSRPRAEARSADKRP